MPISWYWLFSWLAIPRPPTARFYWQNAGYHCALAEHGSPSWQTLCLCHSVNAEGGVSSRLWAHALTPLWLPWLSWSVPGLLMQNRKIHQLRWAGILFHRFPWRYLANRPGQPVTEHRSLPHRCGLYWIDGAPASAAYTPARYSRIPGLYVVWHLGY